MVLGALVRVDRGGATAGVTEGGGGSGEDSAMVAVVRR